MIRIVVFLCAVAVASLGAAWFAERPGDVVITWMGWRIETSLLVVAAGLVLLVAVLTLLWSALRFLLRAPRLAGRALHERRLRKGQRALSKGLIALASGDMRTAQRFAGDASRLAAAEPLTLLLQAQTAQIAGDRAAADTAFRAMSEREDTRLLGLRGLFVEAERRGDHDSARAHAEEATRHAPALPWAGQAVFDFRCAAGDWAAAREALEANVRSGLIERQTYRRQRAVLLTARALDLEHRDRAAARALALEAAKLAPELVPAATLAAHLCAENGEGRRAAKLLEAAWRRNPHPDIADLYAHLRAGNSARDRLARVRTLTRQSAGDREGALAIARAAIDAQQFAEARAALALFVDQPTQRVAMLMAKVEELEHGDTGRAHEWMGRAVHAPRDPAWTADGIVSDRWLPVSPVTGAIDAFVWKVPLAELSRGDALSGEAARMPSLGGLATDVAEPVELVEPEEMVRADAGKDEVHDDTLASAQAAAPPPAASSASAPQQPVARAATTSPRRPAAVIPLMRAPDDPGPDTEVEEVQQPAGSASRTPYA